MSKPKNKKNIGDGVFSYETKKGQRLYMTQLKLTHDGKNWNETKRQFPNKKAAFAYARKRRSEVDLGMNLPQSAQSKNEPSTLGHYIERILVEKENHKNIKGISVYLKDIEKCFGADLDAKLLPTSFQVAKYRRHLENKKAGSNASKTGYLSNCTKRKYFTQFSELIKLICEDSNQRPPRMKNFPSSEGGAGTLTPTKAEFAAIIKELRPINQAAVFLMLTTGMRRTDAMNFRRSQFTEIDNVPHIRFRSSKNQKTDLMVPCPDELIEILESLPVHHPDLFFFNPKTDAPIVDMKTAFKGASRRAGVTRGHFTNHSFRKFASTIAVETTGDVRLVSMLFGWNNPRLLEVVYCKADVAATAVSAGAAELWSSASA